MQFNQRATPRRRPLSSLWLVSLLAMSMASIAAIPSQAGALTIQEVIEDPTLHRGHSTVLRLYQAVLGRQPEAEGAAFWISAYDSGDWDTRKIASHFAASDEFQATYGPQLSNTEFTTVVYRNVLRRSPDGDGFVFWVGQLDAGMTRGEMILLVSNAPEFINANPLPSDTRSDAGPRGELSPELLRQLEQDGFTEQLTDPLRCVGDAPLGANARVTATHAAVVTDPTSPDPQPIMYVADGQNVYAHTQVNFVHGGELYWFIENTGPPVDPDFAEAGFYGCGWIADDDVSVPTRFDWDAEAWAVQAIEKMLANGSAEGYAQNHDEVWQVFVDRGYDQNSDGLRVRVETGGCWATGRGLDVWQCSIRFSPNSNGGTTIISFPDDDKTAISIEPIAPLG